MYELFYCSYAKRGLSDQDILRILGKSEKNNSSTNITGFLTYNKATNQFLQILEGEKENVLDLFGEICIDSRHESVKIIYEGEIEERGFKNFPIQYFELENLKMLPMPSGSVITSNSSGA